MTDPEQPGQVPAPQDLSKVVQGTAENLLNRLEENLTQNGVVGNNPDEDGSSEPMILSSHPGPLGKDGMNVEDVLNIISQSIFREGEGLFTFCFNARRFDEI